MSWIKLALHPDDPKVTVVSIETGASPSEVYFAMVKWLFWLDENYKQRAMTVGTVAFRAATSWPNDKLAKAFQHEDVQWLTEQNGRLSPTRPEVYFSTNAKARAAEADKKKKQRRGQEWESRGTDVPVEGDATGTREEETREEETEESDVVGVVVGNGVGVQGKGARDKRPTITAKQAELYRMIVTRPDGLDCSWIAPERARDLACLRTTSEALIREARKRAVSAARSKARNPAGVAIAFLEKPDEGLAEALSAQEAP